MKQSEYWNNFEKTGNVQAYLKYLACTQEEHTACERGGTNSGNGRYRNTDGDYFKNITRG